MRMPESPAKLTEIAGVRLRRGWRGKLVVQVRYKMVRAKLLPPGQPTEYKDAGLSAWRDADGNDLAEAMAITKHIGIDRDA